MSTMDDRPEARALLAAIHAALPALEALLAKVSGEWGFEEPVYRFYQQSDRVFAVAAATDEIVAALAALAPGRALAPAFTDIVRRSDDPRRLLEAFFHARAFLDMLVKYGRQLAIPPARLPVGWAGVLQLYGLR